MQMQGFEAAVATRQLRRVLVANRGEIAIRIAHALADAGVESVAVYSEDDAQALHVLRADDAAALSGSGPTAYLDADALVALALARGCDAVHPGYGFLSESPEFAAACEAAGLCFIGPTRAALATLGDKVRAREVARDAGVPVLEGSGPLQHVDQARAFFRSLQGVSPAGSAMAIKAVAGGGGRGMRIVRAEAEIAEAFERCRSEAEKAFGSGVVFAERWLDRARHVEVQIAADAYGSIVHLHERECSLQRRHQKLIEIAPAAGLSSSLRSELHQAAVRIAKAAVYRNIGTFEFLVDANQLEGSGSRDTASGDTASAWPAFYFIEANPRLQVEHTVTEEVTGRDLVRLQLDLARGMALSDLGLSEPPVPDGIAIQARVNMEQLEADGTVRPSGGRLAEYVPPSGRGVRVDGYGYPGYVTNPRFDSLLAKVIVHMRGSDLSFDTVARSLSRALSEFRVSGVTTNLPLLQAILAHPEVRAGEAHTRWVDAQAGALSGAAPSAPQRFFASDCAPSVAEASGGERAGDVAPGLERITVPLLGTLLSLEVGAGQELRSGQQIGILEAMKMEHVLTARSSGRVHAVYAAVGQTLLEGDALLDFEPRESEAAADTDDQTLDLDAIRADLQEVIDRHAGTLDVQRPDAIAKRHKLGFRSARENIGDLVDPGSFVEYGALVIAAQRRRRPVDELIERTPADGLVAGLAQINGEQFGPERSRAIVLSYDYTVLAGTQGVQNHRKKDRMFELAESWRLPVVLFSEGGGGRPGDSDGLGVTGLDTVAFAYFGRLSGLVPLVGIVNGRCFAGNAALLGCCDVVIATRRSNIGMGGPAMIEGGGLGVYRPEQIGPVEVQVQSGVIDVLVDDEAEAVAVAKRYLGYFQGRTSQFEVPDQRRLRSIIPENRLRVYDVRHVLEVLADTDSVLELRKGFGAGMVTALIRIEGQPLGVIANNPLHLAGAIDSPGADKAARFMQLCDAFDLPIVFLCDTPGIMVGPEAEATGLVRHAARLFVTAGGLDVPFLSIVLRKGYGLGAQAMAGGSFKSPLLMASWPTGEFGGMGLEGAVRLGFRRELEAIEDPKQRQRQFERMVQAAYANGKAVNVASHFELDAVIDPMETRSWIMRALDSVPPRPERQGKKRPCVDTW